MIGTLGDHHEPGCNPGSAQQNLFGTEMNVSETKKIHHELLPWSPVCAEHRGPLRSEGPSLRPLTAPLTGPLTAPVLSSYADAGCVGSWVLCSLFHPSPCEGCCELDVIEPFQQRVTWRGLFFPSSSLDFPVRIWCIEVGGPAHRLRTKRLDNTRI